MKRFNHMTKEQFMYITGITDEEQLENIMLLEGDSEPEDGDWTELLKKWFEELKQYANKYEHLYLECSRREKENVGSNRKILRRDRNS